MSRLLAELQDRSQSIFALADVQQILGLTPALASSLMHKAVRRGVISRIKSGLFVIVPAEMGSSTTYAGNPYLTAMRLAGQADSFISHASAMEIHRMVTQPQLGIFVSSTNRVRNCTVTGTEFHFVRIKLEHSFGTLKHWATKQEAVNISDLERTVMDGLRQPEYCGGITDVAKGLWMRHSDMQSDKLVDYALRLNVGAVTRRLGYLLELYGIAPGPALEKLRTSVTATYVPLDPTLPHEGSFLKRWRLQINISPNELEAVRGT